MITMEWILHGRVQGVGMRYFIQRSARQFQLTGTVRNVSDGTVEVIIQGPKTVVLTFLDVVQNSAPGYLERVVHKTIETSVVYSKFQIKLF